MLRSVSMALNVRIAWALVVAMSGCGRVAYESLPEHDGGLDMNAPIDMHASMDMPADVDTPNDLGADSGVDAAMIVDAGIDAPVDLGTDMPFVPGEILVTPTSALITDESGAMSATFTVALADAPSANVFISISSSDNGEGTPDPTTLAFTSINFAMPQTVTISGVDDVLVDGDVSYSIVIAPAVSADSRYANVDADDLTLVNQDDDLAGVTLSRTSGVVTSEAGLDDSFTVRLDTEPSDNVTVSFSSDDLSEGTVSPGGVTFTSSNWNIPQTITVSGVDDVLADGDVAFNIVSSDAASADSNYNGLVVDDVSATNTDNETPGFTVTPTSGLMTSEAGGTASFVIVLDSQPTDDVSLTLTSDNTLEGTVSAAPIVFTALDWNVPQMITVTGADDLIDDGDVVYTIVTSAATSADPDYNAIAIDDVQVTNIDNDAASVVVTPTSGLITTERATTATFTITLASEPTADVSIALSSSDTNEGTVSPGSVTFTSMNWMTPQMVTVTGVDEHVLDADVAYSIITATPTSTDTVYAGLTVADVAVTNQTWPDYIKASNTDAGDHFGEAIAISEDGLTLVVSAPFEDSAATGINGTQSSNAATDSGAVYVFVRSGDTWTQEAYIKASNTQLNDQFGASIALSADGNTLVVGALGEDSNATGINGNQANNTASSSGAVYAFTRSAGVWTQQAYIKASNTGMGDYFGVAIGLSDDGNTLAVGAMNEDSNGLGVGAAQGNNLDGESGAVYVFTRSGVVWSQQVYIKDSMPAGYFGVSLSLAGNGDTLAVGSFGAPALSDLSVFFRSAGVWSEQLHVVSPSSSVSVAINVSLSNDGNTLLYSYFDSGSRAIDGSTRSGMTWTPSPRVEAPAGTMQFAFDIVLASNGLRFVASDSTDSSPATRLNGDSSASGATNSGAAYMYAGGPGAWSQLFYIKASNTDANDRFASTNVAVEPPPPFAMTPDANVVALGTVLEDSNATGIGGNEANNGASASGAVYVYR